MIKRVPAGQFHRVGRVDFIAIQDIMDHHPEEERQFMIDKGLFAGPTFVGGEYCVPLVEYQRVCCYPCPKKKV